MGDSSGQGGQLRPGGTAQALEDSSGYGGQLRLWGTAQALGDSSGYGGLAQALRDSSGLGGQLRHWGDSLGWGDSSGYGGQLRPWGTAPSMGKGGTTQAINLNMGEQQLHLFMSANLTGLVDVWSLNTIFHGKDVTYFNLSGSAFPFLTQR